MTQQSLITRLKAVEEALDFYGRYLGRSIATGEPFSMTPIDHDCGDRARAALSDLRELIKEAEGQEPTMIRVLGEDGWQANAKLIPHYTALGEKPAAAEQQQAKETK